MSGATQARAICEYIEIYLTFGLQIEGTRLHEQPRIGRQNIYTKRSVTSLVNTHSL